MNKILLLAFSLLLFSCDKKTQTHKTRTSETTANESVEMGSGTEISPQLEGVQDSAKRLEVDTISSAEEAREREK